MTLGCWLGIDPGKRGGFALISHEEVVLAWPMPGTETGVGKLFQENK